MRANHDNSRSRPFGHRSSSSSARPDPGRGIVMSGSRARDIRRRREDRRYLGGQVRPQSPHSLVNRITVDRGGRAGGHGRGRGYHHHHHAQGAGHGGRGQTHARPLTDRITGGNGTGMGRVGTQAAGRNDPTVPANTAAHGNGFGSHNNNSMALFTTPQQPWQATRVGAQEPTFPFDPLFGEPMDSPVPQARTPVSVTMRTPEARTTTANNRPKLKPIRVVKNPVNIFSNPKLRAVLSGTKTRAPKPYNGMMLRVGKSTTTLQGHELTCASPARSNVDDYDGGDDNKE